MGGKSKVAQLSHTSRRTIAKGQQDAQEQEQELGKRIRKAGGGRKKTIDNNPEILLKNQRVSGTPYHGKPDESPDLDQ